MHTTLVVHCLTYPCVKNIVSDSNDNGNAREKSGQEGNRGCAFQFGWFIVSGTLSSLLFSAFFLLFTIILFKESCVVDIFWTL
jgi:hypothetical protein